MSVVCAPPHVALAASQARIRLLDSGLRGEGYEQARVLGERVALSEPLSREDQLNLRSVLSRAASSDELQAIHFLLGGDVTRDWLFRSELPERPLLRMSTRLSALDQRLAERILGQMEAIFVAAVGRTAIRVAKSIKTKRVGVGPVEFLDAQPVSIVRDAISQTEEGEVVDTVADIDTLLPPILLAAVGELVGILRDETGVETSADRLLPEPALLAAVDVARRSLVSLILGRLSRSETEAVTSVPPNIARDVLHAAGGADVSVAGGIPKGNMGRVLVAGVEATGDGFATSQIVVEELNAVAAPGQRVETVRRWRHSGKADAVEAHRRNDGKRDIDCDFSAGPPGALRNCGCRWVSEVEVVA